MGIHHSVEEHVGCIAQFSEALYLYCTFIMGTLLVMHSLEWNIVFSSESRESL